MSYYTVGFRGLGAKHDCFKKDTIFEVIDFLIDQIKYDAIHKLCVAFWEESFTTEDKVNSSNGFYCTWRYSGDDFLKLINKVELPENGGMYPIWVCDKKEPNTGLKSWRDNE